MSEHNLRGTIDCKVAATIPGKTRRGKTIWEEILGGKNIWENYWEENKYSSHYWGENSTWKKLFGTQFV